MEDQVCPRCRTTKYRNPSLKLLVNVCGHSLCESCVDLLFLKGSGSCPECQTPLRRCNFRLQLFEDPSVEKEVDVRKRVLREYNKKEDDFDTLEEFNDYLEEIEEIIFNLTNGVDVIETNKRIEAYKRENKDLIQRNKVRTGRLENELEELIEEEKRAVEKRRLDAEKEEFEVKRRRLRVKEALLDELAFSDTLVDASSIVKSFAQKGAEEEAAALAAAAALRPPVPVQPEERGPKRATAFSTGIKFGSGAEARAMLPAVKRAQMEEGPLYTYRSPIQSFEGPTPPKKEALTSGEYLVYMRVEKIDETAGGFDMGVACLRAMQEAVAGLYYSPRDIDSSKASSVNSSAVAAS